MTSNTGDDTEFIGLVPSIKGYVACVSKVCANKKLEAVAG